MQINVNALNENLQYQKSALIFYKSAGIISEREYEILFNSIIRLERVNDNALEEKERFLPDVEITEKYSF